MRSEVNVSGARMMKVAHSSRKAMVMPIWEA
jgi:hypothetical protein